MRDIDVYAQRAARESFYLIDTLNSIESIMMCNIITK